MPFLDPHNRDLTILALGAVLAAAIRLVTYGASVRTPKPTILEVAAEAIGAAVAAFVFGALLIAYYTVPPEFYWGLSGVAGLLGGRLLLIGALAAERRFGLKGLTEHVSRDLDGRDDGRPPRS